jgi:hypothetical protein
VSFFSRTEKLSVPLTSNSELSCRSWKTCLGNGTGSALKGEGLQRHGLKAVLYAGGVFGRACGAASTTLPGELSVEVVRARHRVVAETFLCKQCLRGGTQTASGQYVLASCAAGGA